MSPHATPAHPNDTWATAFTNLQHALDAVSPGDTIHLAGDVFGGVAQGATTLTRTVFLLRNATNLLVRGGYEADPDLPIGDHPGPHNPAQWPTVLTRTSGNCRVLSISGVSNTVFEHLTISNGYEAVSSGTRYGGGIYLSSSRDVVFNACRIVNNQSRGNPCYGGAIYLAGSTLTLTNCLLRGNQLNAVHNGVTYGGAVFVDGNSRLTVAGSVLQDNWALGGGSGRGLGGGIYVDTGGILDIRQSALAGNRARHGSSSGGAIHNLGTLTLRNTLLVSNRCERSHSDGLWLGGGSALLDNCTLADNNDIGLRYGAGTVAVSNSIIWGHTVDLMNFPEVEGVLPGVWHSNIGDGQNAGAQGCLSVDPLFADRIHYHLQSTEGHYTNGYFYDGFWTHAAANSPMIDRGDPNAGCSREPDPNGERLNLGAYGNTEVAAKTADLVVDPPTATNHGALAWGHRTVILRGEITDDGGEFSEAALHYWQDGSVTTNVVPQGIKAQGKPFEITLSGLTPGTVYSYRVSASNRAAMTFSSALPFAMHPPASALYVATNGNHTAGTNWSTAYSDLQAALDIAEDGDVIYLAGGQTFSDEPGFGLQYVFLWSGVSNVTIRGGYEAADHTELPGGRDREQWPTVIARASGDARVLSLSGLSNCVIEQVTVRGGDLYVDSGMRYGGGIRLSDCQDIVFSDCRIESNRVRANPGYGGGIDLNNSSLTLTDCLVVSNTIPARHNGSALGGAAYLNGGSRLTVIGSHVLDNQANGSGGGTGRGGAFYVEPGGILALRESVLTGNRSTRNTPTGGAIDNRGTLTIRNSLLTANRSDSHSDAILSTGASAWTLIESSTIADNHERGVRYGGGAIALTNTIVWGHATADLVNLPEDGGILLNVAHCLFDDPAMDGVNGCIAADPRFIGSGDYRLRNAYGVGDPLDTSPAIDAGINLPWMAGATDLDGRSRVMPTILHGTLTVDIGVYENLPPQGTLLIIR